MTNEPFKGSVEKMLANKGSVYHEPYVAVRLPFRVAVEMPNCFEAIHPAYLPYVHQQKAFERLTGDDGRSTLVATGTGSGKTECFMWPLLAKMAAEARNSKESWAKRGVRTIIMYPMNALVSDQVSRLRRMIGDPDERFIKIFRKTCGDEVRRPQFGMYTGRTPYPGVLPSTEQDRKLEKTLARMSFPQSDSEKEFFNHLLKEGKIPAKADMNQSFRGYMIVSIFQTMTMQN